MVPNQSVKKLIRSTYYMRNMKRCDCVTMTGIIIIMHPSSWVYPVLHTHESMHLRAKKLPGLLWRDGKLSLRVERYISTATGIIASNASVISIILKGSQKLKIAPYAAVNNLLVLNGRILLVISIQSNVRIIAFAPTVDFCWSMNMESHAVRRSVQNAAP